MPLNLFAVRWVDKNSGNCIEVTEIKDDQSMRFAVRDRLGLCLNKQSIWVYEPMPSERDADFLSHCRFDDFGAAAMALERSL